MKTDAAKKVTIKVAPQEVNENLKNSRKTLRVLQQTATDKENLVGRSRLDKDIKLSDSVKQKSFAEKEVQTDAVITVEDLTSENPSVDYWRKLAEKRAEDLDRSFRENEKLKDDIEALQEENRICKVMLDESKALVEVLQEMLEEPDTAEVSEVVSEDK
ncbi:hypothetical protein WA026_001687 [Henosepilachna vigintioctopunctata]|uniref:Geminin n=1 Tax=Henosepilachna vigintioctopunctata TaxID=420089 RepID=A0AAW1UIS3_9CUCU